MNTLELSIDSLRSLSRIFTTSNFRKVIFHNDTSRIDYWIQKHLNKNDFSSYSELITYLYDELTRNYCNEYIYKNKLLQQELLQKYKTTSNTIMFDELQIWNSKADFIILNWEIKVFEIKTELDSFYKLEKQLNDYKKIANKVYLVISYKDKERALSLYEKTNIWIIVLTKKLILKEEKKALNNTNFDYEIIFKVLRKEEYLNIIKDFFWSITLDELLKKPNTLVFSNALELVKKIDIIIFQKLALKELKNRIPKDKEKIYSSIIPKELKHICYNLNLSENEYCKLNKFLIKKI